MNHAHNSVHSAFDSPQKKSKLPSLPGRVGGVGDLNDLTANAEKGIQKIARSHQMSYCVQTADDGGVRGQKVRRWAEHVERRKAPHRLVQTHISQLCIPTLSLSTLPKPIAENMCRRGACGCNCWKRQTWTHEEVRSWPWRGGDENNLSKTQHHTRACEWMLNLGEHVDPALSCYRSGPGHRFCSSSAFMTEHSTGCPGL